MIRLASIGSRVEMATLMAVSTTASMKASSRPGAICSISRWQSASVGSARADSRASYTTLYDTLARNSAPRTRNMIATGTRMPKNLPRMNSRRPTGFDSSVSAVRPSISSAIDTLAVHRAIRIDNTMISVRPSSLTILMSSPSVL